MKSRNTIIYTVLVLGDKIFEEGIKDCMVTTCTNKRVLAELSDIPFDRLVYIFTKLKRNYLYEKGVLILKSEHLYVGRQIGGLRNKSFNGFNRNK